MSEAIANFPNKRKYLDSETGYTSLRWKPFNSFPHPGHIVRCTAPDRQPPATKTLQSICRNNTSIVSSLWWCAYKCPKYVEQIISAINHSVASSWFSFLRLYNDARTNIHEIYTLEFTVLTAWSQDELSHFNHYFYSHRYNILWKGYHFFATHIYIFVSLLDLIVKNGGTRFFETNNSLKTAHKQEQTAPQVNKQRSARRKLHWSTVLKH